jgi:3-phenylpropionate/cinnamic acid dioxygenase small subunit
LAKPSIEDRLAIEDLFIRYATALDNGDVDGVVGCFTEDGWLDSPIVGRHEGREQLRAFAERIAESIRLRGARYRHVVGNFRIETTQNRAKARCYLLDFVTIGENCELLSPGEYDCELEKIGGEWFFVSRIVRMDRTFSIP